jgi:hypothetical protein
MEHMNNRAVRPEVRVFLAASNALVCSTSATLKDFSREECEAIARCVMELSNTKHQWSKYLLSRYT